MVIGQKSLGSPSIANTFKNVGRKKLIPISIIGSKMYALSHDLLSFRHRDGHQHDQNMSIDCAKGKGVTCQMLIHSVTLLEKTSNINYPSARGVMVIITGYGHGDTSSIPGQD